MIADLIEGNLNNHPSRSRLLRGPERRVQILAPDVEGEVGLAIGNGMVRVSSGRQQAPAIEISTDSETLLDLPRARLLGGLPSIADPIGRSVTRKMLTGRLKVRGIRHLGLLTRVQRLLTVA
jgi:hypothetical protein